MRCEFDQSHEKTRIPEELCTDWLLRLGLVLARVWGGEAVAPTERVKLRRQIAAAACKKKSVSLSLFS